MRISFVVCWADSSRAGEIRLPKYHVPNFIYAIAASPEGPVKLGISAQPERRVSQLQTGHCSRLRVYHTEPVPTEKARLFERLLHRDLSYIRAVGEWFNMTVADAIAHIQFTLIQYDAIDDLAGKVRAHRV